MAPRLRSYLSHLFPTLAPRVAWGQDSLSLGLRLLIRKCAFWAVRPRRQMAPRGHLARGSVTQRPGFGLQPHVSVLCDLGQVASRLWACFSIHATEMMVLVSASLGWGGQEMSSYM